MSERYSFSLTTFSPSGKLVQIEHALSAVQQGATSVGLKAHNGVVIATEKKLPSPLIEEGSFEKVTVLGDNLGMVYSGMGPDFRVLVGKARKFVQKYKLMYGEYPPTSQLVRDIASVVQESTQSGGVRPFGVSLLISGIDDEGHWLYQVDPSGAYWAWKATAIGKNMLGAKNFLEKRYNERMELDDAVHTAILALKEGFEGQMNEYNIEIGIATSANKSFRRLSPREIRDYLANIG